MQIAPGWGNPELLCHMAHSLGFYGDGAGFVTGEKRAGHKFWKNDIAQGHNINRLKSDESKMADKSLNLNWQAKWDTRGATTAPKVRVKVVPNSLWSMDYTIEFSWLEFWSGSHSLLQGIFPTQGSNQGLPHCRWILCHLSHQGNPRIVELVTYPFSSGSSRPRNQTRVSCIAGGSLPVELPGKPYDSSKVLSKDQGVGGSPITGNLHPFPKTVGIILSLISR